MKISNSNILALDYLLKRYFKLDAQFVIFAYGEMWQGDFIHYDETERLPRKIQLREHDILNTIVFPANENFVELAENTFTERITKYRLGYKHFESLKDHALVFDFLVGVSKSIAPSPVGEIKLYNARSLTSHAELPFLTLGRKVEFVSLATTLNLPIS